MNQIQAIGILKPEHLGMTMDEVSDSHEKLANQWEERNNDPEYLRELVALQSVLLCEAYAIIEKSIKSTKPKTGKFTDRLKAKYGRK